MDELQARIRTIRSLQTDMNLAEQPYPEFEHSDNGQRQGEANVVEMPNRQAQENPSSSSPAQRSTTKRRQDAAKRKPATANPKAFPFRQMCDGHQQPYIDELKRLEAQAERINQLLADRKRKKAQAEPSIELTNGETSTPKKRTAKGSKQPSRSLQREVLLMPAENNDTEALEAQAERIKHLLMELETAIVLGEAPSHSDAIKHSIDEDRSQPFEGHPSTPLPPSASSAESFASDIYSHGAGTRSISASQRATPEANQKAQQEATETAQALRYLASRDGSREHSERTIAGSTHHESHRAARSRSSQQRLSPLRRYGLQLQQFLKMPQKSLDKVGDAVLWIVLAAAIRVGARFLLALFPALSPFFMLLMFAPAALAVYLAIFVPRAGFVSIYRLFLVMLGLLLGGRLG